jgi:hypothetical protein
MRLLDTPGVAFVPVNTPPPPPPEGAELVPPPTFKPAFPVLV